MRRIMLMVFAVALFGLLGGTTTAMASSSSGKSNAKRCNNPGGGNSKHGCKPCPAGQERHGSKCRPKPCPPGKVRGSDGKCKPKPCPAGQERHGSKCKPKPCPAGQVRDKHGDCKPPPVHCDDDEINVGGHCVPRPPSGPCSKADLVLLEDLLKGTGGLVCVYLGENAPNASKDLDCPEAALALPIDNLLGACLYLPPAEVDRGEGGGTPEIPGIPEIPGGLPELPELPGLPMPGGDPHEALAGLLHILCGCAS
jgi:hypothetical protein